MFSQSVACAGAGVYVLDGGTRVSQDKPGSQNLDRVEQASSFFFGSAWVKFQNILDLLSAST